MKKRILVIDDDQGVANMMSMLLGHMGYDITVAHTPDEVSEKLSSGEFDLAIVDGDLGDRKCTEDSLSGRVILDQLEPIGLKYGRHTAQPDDIPERLAGEFIAVKPETAPLFAHLKRVLGENDASGEETQKIEIPED